MLYRGSEDAVQPKVSPNGKLILFRQGASRFNAQLILGIVSDSPDAVVF
jgi:hypothetical protein